MRRPLGLPIDYAGELMKRNTFLVIIIVGILFVIICVKLFTTGITLITELSQTTNNVVIQDDFKKYYGETYQWYFVNCDPKYAAFLEAIHINDKVLVGKEELIVILEKDNIVFKYPDGSLFSAKYLYNHFKLNENDYLINRFDKDSGRWINIIFYNKANNL
jgi:hypothetical protein